MQWNSEQEHVLKDMGQFVKDKDRRVYHLRGRAGTGKTTISSAVRDRHDNLRWIALAYTGKAASVLRSKHWDNAATINSKLTLPGMASRARLNAWKVELEAMVHANQTANNKSIETDIANLKKKIDAEEINARSPVFIYNQETELMDYDVMVVDEGSMIGDQLGEYLMKVVNEAGNKLIVMGDDNQLPPVKSHAYFMDVTADFMLTKIERQREGDPILHLADLALERKPLPLGTYGDSRVTNKLDLQECMDCDQMLVGKNDTRKYYTERLRQERGYTDIVEVGEKLMCLANDAKRGYYNGTIWYVQEVYDYSASGERIMVRLSSDDDHEADRNAWLHVSCLKTGEKVDWREAEGAQSMVSAEACTVHKFQGSQGKHIVLVDESGIARQDAHRWLYTGITRAQEKVSVRVMTKQGQVVERE